MTTTTAASVREPPRTEVRVAVLAGFTAGEAQEVTRVLAATADTVRVVDGAAEAAALAGTGDVAVLCLGPGLGGTAARDLLGEWALPHEQRLFTNIVMMGMGEPLYNYDNVAAALKIIMDGEGFSLSRRRITLSTSGVVPLMQRCGEELNVNLAVSLHAVTDELRNELVPLNRKYPLAMLLDACRAYPGANNARPHSGHSVAVGAIDSPQAGQSSALISDWPKSSGMSGICRSVWARSIWAALSACSASTNTP